MLIFTGLCFVWSPLTLLDSKLVDKFFRWLNVKSTTSFRKTVIDFSYVKNVFLMSMASAVQLKCLHAVLCWIKQNAKQYGSIYDTICVPLFGWSLTDSNRMNCPLTAIISSKAYFGEHPSVLPISCLIISLHLIHKAFQYNYSRTDQGICLQFHAMLEDI